jgi:hypothetical protein
MTSEITLMPVLSQIPEKKFQDSINLCREVADTNDIKKTWDGEALGDLSLSEGEAKRSGTNSPGSSLNWGNLG